MVHLLGVSSFKWLAGIPVEYCDSSSWTQEVKFGQVYYWNPEKKEDDKTDIISLPDYEPRNQNHSNYIDEYEYVDDFLKNVSDSLGFSFIDIMGRDKFFCRSLVNIHYYVTLQNELRKEHKKRGFNV